MVFFQTRGEHNIIRMLTRKLIARFWSYVKKTNECWVWDGALKNGYGCINIYGKILYAHRVGWQLRHGKIPNGKFLCYRCDNRKCVRPDHMFLGTPKDNTHDMMKKGRYRGPSATGKIVLTAEQVVAARAIVAAGTPLSEVMELLGVSRGALWNAVHGRSWSELPGAV